MSFLFLYRLSLVPSGSRRHGLWQIPQLTRLRLPPTTKQLELAERAVSNSSCIGDAVPNLFLGPGATLIARERTNRIRYAMVRDPRHVHGAVASGESFTGLQTERIVE